MPPQSGQGFEIHYFYSYMGSFDHKHMLINHSTSKSYTEPFPQPSPTQPQNATKCRFVIPCIFQTEICSWCWNFAIHLQIFVRTKLRFTNLCDYFSNQHIFQKSSFKLWYIGYSTNSQAHTTSLIQTFGENVLVIRNGALNIGDQVKYWKCIVRFIPLSNESNYKHRKYIRNKIGRNRDIVIHIENWAI